MQRATRPTIIASLSDTHLVLIQVRLMEVVYLAQLVVGL